MTVRITHPIRFRTLTLLLCVLALYTLTFNFSASAQTAGIEKIAFVTADEQARTSTIMLVNPDGTNAQPFITSNTIYSPTWSPDGRHLAFTATTPREYRPAIYVIDSDGTNAHKVSGDNQKAAAPVWSGDSQQLMYLVDVGYGQKVDLYRVNIDGTDAQKVSMPSDAAPFFLAEYWLAWSPDSSQIALHTTDEVNFGQYGLLYLAAPDMSNPALFPATAPDGASFSQLRWSPDGQRVVLNFFNGAVSQHDILAVANADGSNLREIQGAARNLWTPAWSPDGSQIVFAASEAGVEWMPDLDLWVVNADGSNLRSLNIDTYVTFQGVSWGLLPADTALPSAPIVLADALG